MAEKDNAISAAKEYDGVKLDGKPMTIRVIGGSKTISEIAKETTTKKVVEKKPSIAVASSKAKQETSTEGSLSAHFNGLAERGHAKPLGVGRGRRGRGRGGRGGFRGGRKPTETDLNAELDAYFK